MIIRLLLLIVLVCSTNVSAMSGMPNSTVEQAAAGKQAAEFTLSTINNPNMTLTQAREGKKSILFFWATWCPHCREELERLRLNYKDIESKGIKILLVNSGESKEDVQSYFNKQQIPFDCFLDEDNTISGLFGVVGIPTLFFIDEKGIIQSVEHEFPSDVESKFSSK